MARDLRFGILQDDEDMPAWRAFFADLEEAKREAQALANEHGRDCSVLSMESFTVLASLRPSNGKSKWHEVGQG